METHGLGGSALQAAPIYGLSLDDAIALANGTRIPGRRPKPRNIVEKGASTEETADARQGVLDFGTVDEVTP